MPLPEPIANPPWLPTRLPLCSATLTSASGITKWPWLSFPCRPERIFRKHSCVTLRFLGRRWRCLMHMRSATALLASLTLLAPVGLTNSKLEVRDLQKNPFQVDFPSGSRLRLHLRSGEFRIVGRDDNKISVHFQG